MFDHSDLDLKEKKYVESKDENVYANSKRVWPRCDETLMSL